jgi:S1/P1 Nuclease
MKTAQVLSILLLATTRVLAWGDDGHKTVALIAEHFLDPAVKAKVTAMLDADPDDLTPHDLASEATWADKYRDSSNRRDHYAQTQNWHFIDLEIDNPDIKTAWKKPLKQLPATFNARAESTVVRWLGTAHRHHVNPVFLRSIYLPIL